MKINFLKNCALAAGILFCLFSCEQEGDPEQVLEESLGIEDYNPDHVKGTHQTNGVDIKFNAFEKAGDVIDITVSVKNQDIIAQISFIDESMHLDGSGIQLSKAEKAALLETSQKLFTYIDGLDGELSYAEYGLIRMMEYWSNAPSGYVYNSVEVASPYTDKQIAGRLGNEGITCIRRGSYVNAEYDDSRGRQSDRVRVGSKARSGYGCMGRCGADCGRWWIPSSWTKDCMDHDQCSNVNNSSGGSSDRNCGDEFNEAADDWAFGVIRGCRG